MSEVVLRILALGVGATLAMDAWALLLKVVYGVNGLDYAHLGRWLGHLPGTLMHPAGIGRAAPVRAERVIGWAAHYAIGIVFAAGLVAASGPAWLAAPTMLPALITGLVTLAAPWLVLQPAFGLGIAAARSPNPMAARLRSLITHLIFAAGLYLAARLIAALAAA